MTVKSRAAMGLTSAIRISSVFAGICCAIVSPDQASAQGWGAAQYSVTSNDNYTFTTSGTGAGSAVVIAPLNNTPTPSLQGTALGPTGAYMAGLRTMVAGNAATIGGQAELKGGALGAGISNWSATYYDAQGRAAVPNSGYTWTGITYSSLLFSTAANYTTNNSIIQTNQNGYGTVQLQDGLMCVGSSSQGQPQGGANGYSGTTSVYNSADFGFQNSNYTGPFATYQGPGTDMTDFTISGVLYYQNGQLTWGSETGDGIYVTLFGATTTQAQFAQSGATGVTSVGCQLDTPHVLSRSGQGDATCFSIAYISMSGAPS